MPALSRPDGSQKEGRTHGVYTWKATVSKEAKDDRRRQPTGLQRGQLRDGCGGVSTIPRPGGSLEGVWETGGWEPRKWGCMFGGWESKRLRGCIHHHHDVDAGVHRTCCNPSRVPFGIGRGRQAVGHASATETKGMRGRECTQMTETRNYRGARRRGNSPQRRCHPSSRSIRPKMRHWIQETREARVRGLGDSHRAGWVGEREASKGAPKRSAADGTICT